MIETANNVNCYKEDKSTKEALELIFLLIKKNLELVGRNLIFLIEGAMLCSSLWIGKPVLDNEAFLKKNILPIVV